MKVKITLISLYFYILSATFLACGILSIIIGYQKITTIFFNDISIQGTEFTIVTLYLQSSVQYLAFSVLLFIVGWLSAPRHQEMKKSGNSLSKKNTNNFFKVKT